MITNDGIANSLLISSSLIPETHFNFEQLFIFGIHPDKKEDSKPEVLVAFPPYKLPSISPEAILDHSLPFGTKKRKTKSGSNLIQEEFSFIVKENENNYYCAAVIFLPHEGKKLPFFVNPKTKKTQFSICLVSKVPSIASHLSFLTFLVNAMSGQLSNINIIRVKPESAVYSSYEVIEGLIELSSGFGCVCNFQIPDYFYDSVSLYHMCGPGTPPIVLGPKNKLYFPPNDDVRQIIYSGLDTIFSVTDVRPLIDVLTGILLDYQILVIGSSMEEVSMTVLTLVQLIEPLKYSGMVIPLLPTTNPDYIDLLGAPTPYIIGTLPCDAYLNVEFIDTIIFLNLDKKIIQINSDLPPYPNKEFIIKKLKQVLSTANREMSVFSLPEEHISCLKHKYLFSPQVCDSIVKILRQPLELILSDFICSFFVTDLDKEKSSTYFNKELFIECMPKDRFHTELADSQTFELWTTKKLEEYLLQRGEEMKKTIKKRPRENTRTRKRSLSVQLLGIE